MESTVSNELEIEDETEVIEVGTTSPQLKEEEPIEDDVSEIGYNPYTGGFDIDC